jgi:hypothetical protein
MPFYFKTICVLDYQYENAGSCHFDAFMVNSIAKLFDADLITAVSFRGYVPFMTCPL